MNDDREQDRGRDRRQDPAEEDLLDLPLDSGPDSGSDAGPDSGSDAPDAPPEVESAAGAPRWDSPPEPPPGAGADGEGEEPAAGRRNRLPMLLLVALALVLLLALAGLLGYLLPRPAPAVVRAEPAVLDFGVRSVGVAGDAREIVITSTGERPARIDAARIDQVRNGVPEAPAREEGAGDEQTGGDAATVGEAGTAPFRVTSDGCSGGTLQPARGCAVAVAFTPDGAGSRRAVLEIRGDFANSPLELPLLGEGVAPHLTLDRRRLDLGAHPVGAAPVSEVLTVENDGTAPLGLDGFTLDGPAAGDFTVSASACLDRPLAPGVACPVSVAFSPAAEGERRATLRPRPGPAGRGMEIPAVALSGTGLPAGPAERLAVEGEAGPLEEGLVFGAVAAGRGAEERTLRLVNRGDEPVALAAIGIGSGGEAFSVAGGGCPAPGSLAPGESCGATVRFAPPAADGDGEGGALEGTLTISLGDGAGGAGGAEGAGGLEVRLRGRAVVPRLVSRPRAVDFGESRIGRDGPTREVLFASTGTGAVEVRSLRVEGADAGAFVPRADGCSGETLAPGEECRVEVTFRPRQEGVQSGRLAVVTPSLEQPPAVTLGGAGSAPRIGVDPRSLELGPVRVSRTEIGELVVRSAGRAPVEVRRIDLRPVEAAGGAGSGAGVFRIESEECTEPLALAPGETCRVVVRFTPVEEGEPRAELLIVHDGVGSPSRVEVRGTALPAPAPRFAVVPERVRFGTVPVGGRSGIETVTVRNDGTARMVLEAVRIEGADAGEFRVVPGSCEGAPFVSPGSECTIGVRFIPAGAGDRRGELVIRHDAAGGIGRVELVGSGG